MNNNIWIVTPCYFDLPSFEWLRQELLSNLSQAYPEARIRFVLVDDSGGQDISLTEEWKEQFNDVHLICVPFNLGHQGAIVYGLRTILHELNDSDFVVTMDSDGEDSPKAVEKLISQSLTQKDNLRTVTLAKRLTRYESPVFKFMLLCFQLMFLILTGNIVKTGNFACLRGWFVKNVLNHPFFDNCYSSSLLAMPVKHLYVPVDKAPRKFGRSKMTYVTLVAHGIRMLLPFLEIAAVRTMMLSATGLSIAVLLAIASLAQFNNRELFIVLTGLSMIVLITSLSSLSTAFIFFMMVNQNRAINIRRLSFALERLDQVT